MGRLFVVLAAIALTAALMGCSNSANQTPAATTAAATATKAPTATTTAATSTADQTAATASTDAVSAIVNPVVEQESLEDIQSTIGLSMELPDAAEEITYYVIANNMGEVDFTYDGTQYSFRTMRTAALEDISGTYMIDAATIERTCEGVAYSISYVENSTGIATWYNNNLAASQCIYMAHGANANDLAAMAEILIPLALSVS